jgi:hypothetical protein
MGAGGLNEDSTLNRRDLNSERVTIVYLVGAARSGTSLLTSLLGELDGVFAAAEMRLLWRGYDTRMCGCRTEVSDCSIWSKAVASARAVSSLGAPHEFTRLQMASARNRHLPKLLGSSPNPAARAYLEVMESMYTALAEGAFALWLLIARAADGHAP